MLITSEKQSMTDQVLYKMHSSEICFCSPYNNASFIRTYLAENTLDTKEFLLDNGFTGIHCSSISSVVRIPGIVEGYRFNDTRNTANKYSSGPDTTILVYLTNNLNEVMNCIEFVNSLNIKADIPTQIDALATIYNAVVCNKFDFHNPNVKYVELTDKSFDKQ